MNMIDLADSLNIPRSTLYQRLRREGIPLSELRDESGELKPEAVQVISAMFDSVQANSVTNSNTNVYLLDNMRIQLEAATRECKVLREQLEQERINTEHWRTMAETALKLLPPAAQAPTETPTPATNEPSASGRDKPSADTPASGRDKPSVWKRLKNRVGKILGM